MTNKLIVLNTLSWIFGLIVLAVGLINTFWGNDPGFGIFLMILSLVYFPPVNHVIRIRSGFIIPVILKILLGIFIIWASLGVAELFDKIDLMMNDF